MTLHPVARIVFDPDFSADRLPLYAVGAIEVTGRHDGKIAPGGSVSFASYFNAFPAWHWYAFTTVREVELSVEIEGQGTLIAYQSDARGNASVIDRRQVDGVSASSITIDLEPNAEGGWVWFDLHAGSSGLHLKAAHWQVDAPQSETRLASLAMTTINKPDFVLGVLSRITSSSVALAALDEVIVIDQGTDKVVDQPQYESTRAALGGRLRVIDQVNLGGSGGFSRGMLEVLDTGRSGSVILIDDDVVLEPESIARAVSFASFAVSPTIVGGHFFDLNRPLQLHAWTEAVDLDRFDWGPVGNAPIDFGTASLLELSGLHEPARPDYNGWWFCLIPVDVIDDIGLSLPSFLKWDDAEYGLRAAAAGYPTVSLPGMAVWHVTWLDKNDALGWQSFYHARNRLLAALVDSRHPGRKLARANLGLDVRFLLTMDYHVAELRHLAYESVLAGPNLLHAELGTRLNAVLAVMRSFSSGVPVPIDAEAPPYEETGYVRGIGGIGAVAMAGWLLLRQASIPDRKVPAEPEARIGFSDARWWRVGRYRHVLAVSPGSSGYQRHKLQSGTLRRMLWRAFSDYWRMRRMWSLLGEEYRAAMPGLVGPGAWRTTLGLNIDDGINQAR